MSIENCVCLTVFNYSDDSFPRFFSIWFHLYSTCCGNNDNNTRSSTSRISTTKYNITGLSNAATTTGVINFNPNFLTLFFHSIHLVLCSTMRNTKNWFEVFIHEHHSLITSFDEYFRYAAQPYPNQAMPPYPMPQPQPHVQGKGKQ